MSILDYMEADQVNNAVFKEIAAKMWAYRDAKSSRPLS